MCMVASPKNAVEHIKTRCRHHQLFYRLPAHTW